MSAESTVDSPDAPATLLGFIGEIEMQTRERGRTHELGRRVQKIVRRNGGLVSANVLTGARLHAVELTRTAAAWRSICTCNQPTVRCEHAAALAVAWLNHLRAEYEPKPDPMRTVMGNWAQRGKRTYIPATPAVGLVWV